MDKPAETVRTDSREYIAALRPCGCIGIIMVLRSPTHTATNEDMAGFYRDVAKAATRKKNPVVLTVKQGVGEPSEPWGCDVCRPPAQRGLFAAKGGA